MDHDFDNAVPVNGDNEAATSLELDGVAALGRCTASSVVTFKGRTGTALSHALREHSADLVARLLSKGGSLSISASCIVSATATPGLPADALQLLLRSGTAKHANGGHCPGQPLRNAARQGRPDLVQLLLAAGADANACMFRGGASPLSVAAALPGDGPWLAAHELLAAGASSMHPPCLPIAVAQGGASMVSLLLEGGAVMPGDPPFPGHAALFQGLQRFARGAFRLRHAQQQARLAAISQAEADLDAAAAVCGVVTQSRGGGYLPPWVPPLLPAACKASACIAPHEVCPDWMLQGVVLDALLRDAPPPPNLSGGGSPHSDWESVATIHACDACDTLHGCKSLVSVPSRWRYEVSLLRQLWAQLHELQTWRCRRSMLLARHTAATK